MRRSTNLEHYLTDVDAMLDAPSNVALTLSLLLFSSERDVCMFESSALSLSVTSLFRCLSSSFAFADYALYSLPICVFECLDNRASTQPYN